METQEGATRMGIASTFIDPLTLTQFLLVYVVVALIPGYALATLVRPHSPRQERVALTIPCAYALTAVCGLTTALLHLPFTLFLYAAFAAPITLAALWGAWHRRRDTPLRIRAGLWLVPVGVAALHLAVTLWVSRGTPIAIGFDAPIHLAYVEAIVRAHIFPITLIASRIGANDGPFYPAAFHGLAALLTDATALPVYRATYLSIVAATAGAPFLLFAYVRVALGTERVAALAALAALAFEPLPQFALAQGLYPLLVAILFLPALALALRRGLWEGERRAVLLAALLGVGILYTIRPKPRPSCCPSSCSPPPSRQRRRSGHGPPGTAPSSPWSGARSCCPHSPLSIAPRPGSPTARPRRRTLAAR